jgi:D-alanyl-D-alanine carboxypeptidase/Putative peptidoglycan binding domain
MSITDLINIPQNTNIGINAARQITMLSLLGNPRGTYDQDCRPITHPTLKNLVVTKSVGNFRVTGLSPAVDSLFEVVADIKNEKPEVFEGLGTAGMLCARHVRGSTTSISNHSWGMAIDLNLNGDLDRRGDGKTQRGLAEIAPIFNRHKWYWGAGFPTEDSMHFEISDQRVREMHANGAFGAIPHPLPEPDLTLGDRGRQVKLLQERLNANGSHLRTDGDFGRGTLAEVRAFQARKSLTVDGVVGRKTRQALGF